MPTKYDHTRIEKKWQDRWEKEQLYVADIDSEKKSFYNLWMFPYPSAEGLHAGHAFASTGSDIFGRFQRMRGREVFQPIGYDSFGIHSENYAIKINENPQDVVKRTTKHYEEQMRSLGHGYDWSRTVTTSDPVYYKWTQWLFAEMFKAGLAYKRKASVNFCPSCKTVLADEQVMSPKAAGKEPKNAKGEVIPETADMKVCERCGTVAEKRELDQWFMRITDYAERLLGGLEKIDWSERVVKAQREWIGKSKGLSIDFKLESSDFTVAVWTKFWETVFGTTFLVVAPEYAKANLLQFIQKDYKEKVEKYIESSLKESEEERTNEKNKTGVDTGLIAINPVNGARVPIWVTDYVLTNVGTGAVMGVPAHDERDFAFARKYQLPIRKVVDVQVETHSLVIKKSVDDSFIKKIEKEGWYFTDYEGWGWGIVFPKGEEDKYIQIVQSSLKQGWYVHTDGVLKEVIFKDKHFSIEKENEEAKEYARKLKIPEEQIDWDHLDNYLFSHAKGGLLTNSGEFNGLDAWDEGKKKMAEWMISKSFASWKTNYHLRDWLVSRQRYWGAPIPMIHCKNCEEKGLGYLSENEPALHKDHSDWDYFGWWIEETLPVVLPPMKEYKPEGTGKGPLSHHPEFYEAKCPHCGEKAERETDVMDTFVDSSWYFLRYPSVKAKTSSLLPFDPEISTKWLPVNLYFGGAEHSVLHLMYARFVNMVMRDKGLLDHGEPFPKFFAHGLMIKDGAKMSKSRGNVVNPDEYVAKFGADTLRMYLMFMGPMDGYPDFRDTGIEGMQRFLNRLWKLLTEGLKEPREVQNESQALSKLHQTIKGVTEDVSEFKYNTAMAKMMELVNYYYDNKVTGEIYLKPLTLMLAPFAPHMMEEIWVEYMHQPFSIHKASWPSYEATNIDQKETVIIIQVNGKVRSQLTIKSDKASKQDEVEVLAKKDEKVTKWIEGGVKKVIFVPGKLINFVI